MNTNNCVENRVYTVEQIAEILSISIRSAYYLCEGTDKFKVIRLGHRLVRVHRESFDKWLDDGCP